MDNDDNINAAVSTVAKGKSTNIKKLKELGSTTKNAGSTPSRKKTSEKDSPLRERNYLYHKASP